MDIALQRALAEHRPEIRTQWERILRLDRGTSALARPDTLVHLLDTTLDEIFASLPHWSARRHATRMPEPVCPCGHSPFLAYFAAGRQALIEALITIQAGMPELEAPARDEAFDCLDQIFSRIARREILAFCSVCQLGPVLSRGRHGPAHAPRNHADLPRSNRPRNELGDSPAMRRNTRLNCDKDWKPAA